MDKWRARSMSTNNKYPHLVFYCLNHIRALVYGLGEIIRSPLASLMTLAVIGIAMALPTGFFLLLTNFQTISHHWSGRPNITLYLSAPAPAPNLLKKLHVDPAFTEVRYISPKQGLKQFSELANLGATLTSLKENPLPPVIVLKPTAAYSSPRNLDALLNQLHKLPGVANIQMNKTWVKRLYYIVSIAKRLTYALAAIFALGVILITGNTIRLTMQNHRQEILVYRLLGASRRMIMRPLLYRGMLYGLLGGIVAWILVQGTLLLLKGPLMALTQSYGDTVTQNTPNIGVCLFVILLCSLLGLTGSWVAARKYLSDPEHI
jgi:cell division transport system permease protein